MRRGDTGFVRHWVSRFDDLDVLARHAVAVAGHHQTTERSLPVGLQRLRHRRRCLAGTDDHSVSLGRSGQVHRHAKIGLRRRHGGVKHFAQQISWSHLSSLQRRLIDTEAVGQPVAHQLLTHRRVVVLAVVGTGLLFGDEA